MKNKLFVYFIFIIILISLPLRAQTANSILTKVKQKYETLNQICAEFRQTFHWKMAGETQITDGKLCTAGGIKFRIEMQDQTIVCDGVTLWTLSKSNQQVLVDNAANGKESNPFLKSFIDKYFKNYKAQLLAEETIDGVPHHHLLLTANTEDEFERSLELWIDKTTQIMRRIKQVDANGNDSIYDVIKLNQLPKLSEQDFKMVVPEGYETVDLR